MEYKRGDRRITLPCKHIYHAGCGTRWLCINKVSRWDFHDKVENNMSCGLFSNSLKSWWPSTYRPAPFATRRFLAMHQNIKVIMTDGHKDENSLIFPCFLSLGIFLAHTVVSIKFSFSSVERKDTSSVINQITNFTQKWSHRIEMQGILLSFYDQPNLIVLLAYCLSLLVRNRWYSQG